MLDRPSPLIPDDPQEIARRMFTAEAKRNPHAYFDRLRELAPVFHDQDSGLWFLTEWEDCNRVLRSDRFGQDGRMKQDPRYPTSVSLQLLGDNLTGMDPPEHTRLRVLGLKGLSRPVVEGMRTYLQELTAQVLDELEDRQDFDLVADYAARIPSTVICEMLGVPREDHHLFDAWVADQFRLLSPIPPSDELLAETDRSVGALLDYLNGLLDERRRSPRNDLLSAFVATDATVEQPMTPMEAVHMANVLLGGGSDTSKSVITLGMLALLQNPDQMKLLQTDPSNDAKAFEELIRYTSPVLIANPRKSYDDVEIGGRPIPAGDLVAPVLVAANFDPKVFADPHRLDLRRSPNPHLAFGHGAHICMGNMLARGVVGHAVTSLVRRFPDLQMVEDSFEPRLDLFAMQGMKSLKVRKS